MYVYIRAAKETRTREDRAVIPRVRMLRSRHHRVMIFSRAVKEDVITNTDRNYLRALIKTFFYDDDDDDDDDDERKTYGKDLS